MTQGDVTTGEIMEILEFIKDNMVTKDDLKQELLLYPTRKEMRETFRQELSWYVTKDYLNEKLFELKSEILSAIDSFAKQNERFDQELVAMRGRWERHEDRLEVVEQKLGISAV